MISTALYNEIAHTHLFEMEQGALNNHARLFLSHYRNLAPEEKAKLDSKCHFKLTASSGFTQAVREDDTLAQGEGSARVERDVYINVIRFSGPMMRNGGGCAYGSIELREMIMQAADDEDCIGQIFIVDTPGGSSATKYDFQEALDYAHSKGQETAMQVDGMVMSAGMAWASLCKKRYARNPHNLFGCMGTYAAFYTNKDGDVNSVTQEVCHIIYADGSPNKNKPFRDAAEGDDTAIREYVNKENDAYKAIIRQGIPNVTDEQLLGGEWEAQDVIGSLCDGIRSLEEIVAEMLTAKGFTLEVKEPSAQSENSQNSITNQISQSMGKQYEKIQAALGLETLESGKDNSLWLHEEMADQLTAFVESAEHTQTALEAKQEEVKNLNEKIKQLTSQVEQLNGQLAEATSAMEEANKQLEEANKVLEAANADYKALQEKASGYEAMLAEQQTKLEEKDAVIAEKEAAIAELSAAPAAPAQPATVQTAQTVQEKPFLASDCKNRKDAKQAHENLKQMLQDRM